MDLSSTLARVGPNSDAMCLQTVPRKRGAIIIPLGIVAAMLLAVLVRLPIILTETGLSTRYSQISDMRGYQLIATNLVKNGRFSYGEQPTAWRPPIYRLFLAAIFHFAIDDFRLVRVVQSCVFLVLIPVVWGLSRRMVSGTGAELAVCLVAVYPIFVHYSTEILSESLAIVCVPLVYLLYLRFDARPSAVRGALLGATMATTLLLRSQVFPRSLLC